MTIVACSVIDEKHTDGRLTRGMCAKHYQRWRKYGTTDAPPKRVYVAPSVESVCVVCSENFTATRKAKFCSIRCRDIARAQDAGNTCAGCGKTMFRSKGFVQGTSKCLDCRSNTHGASAYAYRGCRCQICRDGAAARMREFNRAKRESEGASSTAQFKRSQRGVDPLAKVDCVICREPMDRVFVGSNRPMHRACKDAAPAWKRDGRTNPRILEFQRRIAKAAAGTTGGNRVFVFGPCQWCGEVFMAPGGRYCSVRCKDAAMFKRRSSGATFSPSPRERFEIYERDGWVCQLCELPVVRDAPHGSSWRPTLDHIVPQATVLVPDHSPSNLRLAHLWCNSARGDGSNMSEALLVARARELYAADFGLAV